jgi:hypothetical protein
MSTLLCGEHTRPVFAWRPEQGVVSYGLPFQKHLAMRLERLDGDKVLLIVSGSFAACHTSELTQLRNVIGEKMVLEQIGMKPNSDLSECLDIAMKA